MRSFFVLAGLPRADDMVVIRNGIDHELVITNGCHCERSTAIQTAYNLAAQFFCLAVLPRSLRPRSDGMVSSHQQSLSLRACKARQSIGL